MGRPPGRRAYEFNAEAAVNARIDRGWTQRQVADRGVEMGLPRVHNLAKYERGELCPSPQSLATIAAIFGLQASDLIIMRTAKVKAA
jgi:transcriptional regulator with XRE-family HTH domain